MNANTTAAVRRVALSSLGALLLSAACIVGSVAPAFAAEPTTPNAPLTITDWQAHVGTQLEDKLRIPNGALRNRDHLVGTVLVAFESDGSYSGARILKSSGSGRVDKEMIRVANTIAYPPLPAGLRGRPHSVALEAYFEQGWTQEAVLRQKAATAKALASASRAKHDAVQTAALPSG
jgi:outer membrane biosynthesis protein TonB